MQNNIYTIVQISDLHLLSLRGAKWQEFLNKRIYGLISKIASNKGKINYNWVTEIVEREISRIKPQHIVITGDLTHLSLGNEYKKSREWLDKLSSYSEIMLVPGNHDHYTRKSNPDNLKYWESYTISHPDLGYQKSRLRERDYFPSLVLTSQIALIGLNTAKPCPSFFAYGSVGEYQLQSLSQILEKLKHRNLFKVLVLHYPPDNKHVSKRKGLLDSDKLLELLQTHPVQIALHGHSHKQGISYLNTPCNTISFGTASISALQESAEKRSSINIFQIQKQSNNAWKLDFTTKTYSKQINDFVLSFQQVYYFDNSI